MDRSEAEAESIDRLSRIARKRLSVTSDTLVKMSFLEQDSCLPLVVQPAIKGVNPEVWAAGSREFIEKNLHEYGAILFRNFAIKTPDEFESFAKAISGELLEYRERSSPRSQVSGSIYTSTDYPAGESIFLHNENSYQNTWPMKIFFFCAEPADQGGETPIADCRKIYERIEPSIRDAFIKRKWLYVRNFGEGLGLPWQTVFQTDNKGAIDEYCRKSGIQTEWIDGGRLRTRAIRTTVEKHPRTGVPVWFNHATFFHVSTLSPAIRNTLLNELKEENLPTNTYYGDGSPIEGEVLDHLRECYLKERIIFPWLPGDVLLLDNMLVAHARMPYSGSRRILVAMSEPFSRPLATDTESF